MVLCTGTFPDYVSSKPLLQPDRILMASTKALFPGGTLGILLPLAGQAEGAVARWSGVSTDLAVEVESPYRGDSGLIEIGERLRAVNASMVVVDCMGFTQPKKEVLRRAAGVPIILASSILARFIAEAA